MRTAPVVLLSLLAVATLHAQAPDSGIDFQKARELFQEQSSGVTLSPEDQAYLERAKAAFAARQAHPGSRSIPGQRKAPDRLTPLCDLTASDKYEGEDGGLYGHGSNTPPEPLRFAATTQLARIQPLGPDGHLDPKGAIVFVSISMSNATMEFSTFKRLADASPQKSPSVTIVDCAQGGQTMARWAPPNAPAWTEARRRLTQAGVTPAQVAVAWIKLANAGPSGSFKDHTSQLESDTVAVLHNARVFFPNLRIAYLDSRIYAGYAVTPLNPEPYAYEGAFSVRHLIQRQMSGDPALAETKSPLLLWGPYLWADGARGRKIDNLVWNRSDLGSDGTHPTDSGRQKVATLLLTFFTTDPLAAPWFAKH